MGFKIENGILKKYTEDNVTEIVIPDGVISIDDNAFGYCEHLKEIIIPDSVISIGIGVFSYCECLIKITVNDKNKNYLSIDGVLFNKDCTEMIRYPRGKSDSTMYSILESVTKISDFAFCNCRNLTEIIIPNSVTSIGSDAFRYCKNLKEITIPDSVTSIGRN